MSSVSPRSMPERLSRHCMALGLMVRNGSLLQNMGRNYLWVQKMGAVGVLLNGEMFGI